MAQIAEEQLRKMVVELRGNIAKLDVVKEELNEYMKKYSEAKPNKVTCDALNETYMELESDFVKIEDFIRECISLTEGTIRRIDEYKNNITDINKFG